MGLSFTHLLLILAILLIFFGPSRLPGLGRSIGEAIRGFKKGLDDSGEDTRDVTGSARQDQIKDKEKEEHKQS